MSDDGLRRLKKGEHLFKEGEANSHVYIIKTGKISLYLERSGKKVEIESLGPSQVCGEQAIFGQARAMFSAEAATETRVMEVPVDLMKSQYDASTPGIKLLFKSFTEALKQCRTTIKNLKMEQDQSPLPQLLIPKVLSILTLVADHTGKQNEEGHMVVSWGTLKIYTTRMFLESPIRMEGVLQMLSKLGYTELKYETNEEGEKELVDIILKAPQMIEDFTEFYQYNLFKGGRAEIIYVDPLVMQVTRALLFCAKDVEPDRRGTVTINNDDILKNLKMIFKIDLKPIHLDALEKKGLFVKRQTRDNGVFMSFDKNEFERVYAFWQIILEIDKWNQKGFVDLNEKNEAEIDENGPPSCPTCSQEVSPGQNFCSNCGHRLAA